MAKQKQSSLTSSQAEAPAPTPPAIQITATSFSGPLPDPHTLEYYERVCPGAAREIIEMAKKEQSSRHRDTFRNWLSVVFGQIFGFILGFTGLCGGVFLLYVGKSVTGLSVFIFSLGSLVAAAIWNKKMEAPAASTAPGETEAPRQKDDR